MPSLLLEPHYIETSKRICASNSRYILALQDSTLLNYTNHKAKTSVGRIGKSNNKEQYGLIQHSTLCVTDANEALGLMDLQHFHYDDVESSRHHHHRCIEEKLNYCWIKALKLMRKRLNAPSVRIITVGDRGGDFFEFIHEFIEHSEEFVIRSCHNRYSGTTHRERKEKIWDILEQSPDRGSYSTLIQDASSRQFKEVEFRFKACQVTIPVPNKSKEEKQQASYKPITVNLMKAYNEEHSWILLTSLPIETAADLEEIITIYRARWHIEDYHKILKTAYQVEEIYLHSSRTAIENLLVLVSISACRLYWLIFLGRAEPSLKANTVFDLFEWKSLYVYFQEEIPDQPPPLQEIIFKIARLGGYKHGKNAKPPGIKTMWIGLQKFQVAAQMYKQTLSTKT